ncbi:hypothetical protein [Bradyrhizobium elkanii]|uniref:hypothetical protein n=1 Tax=Bradyrhizobium elkanii TaxID=29448 RepID=UPI0012BCFA53|nr:hypothetical protein [Bradyrhizobium elkanii]
MLIIVSGGFAAPIALGTHFVTVIFGRRSFATIVSGSVATSLIFAACIWLDGIPNNSAALTEAYLGVASACMIVASVFSGRLISPMEAERRAEEGLPIIPD